MPLKRRVSRLRLPNRIGAGSNSDGSYASSAGSAACGGAADRAGRRLAGLRRACRLCSGCVLLEVKVVALARAERDDAAEGIVGRNSHRHAVSGDDLDSKPSHSPAQLREHFVSGIALHAIKAAGVDGRDRPLHVNEIVFAQSWSFRLKLATSVPYWVPTRNYLWINDLERMEESLLEQRVRENAPGVPLRSHRRRSRHPSVGAVCRTSPARGPA